MQEFGGNQSDTRKYFTGEINYLEKIKRVAVCTDDSGSDDYIQFNNRPTRGSGVALPCQLPRVSAEICQRFGRCPASSNLLSIAINVSPSWCHCGPDCGATAPTTRTPVCVAPAFRYSSCKVLGRRIF